MNRLLMAAALAAVLAASAGGCAPRATVRAMRPAPAASFAGGTLPATYAGVMPCADCPGILWTLNLYPDGVFHQRLEYLERGEPGRPARFDDIGRWVLAADGKVLALQGAGESPDFFAVRGGKTLRKLDADARPLDTQLDHDLTRASAFAPFEPRLQLSGLYSYFADADGFTECRTGLGLAVAWEADRLALELAYLAAATEPGQELMAVVEGRLVVRPAVEGPGERPTLVVEKFLRLEPEAACPPVAVEVAPGVTLLRGRFVAGVQPDGNTVILRAPQGLIVVDTGRHAAHAQAIIAYARAARSPVQAIVNTHWHLDHIGGNPRLRREYPGVRVYASGALAGAMTGFLKSYRAQLEAAVAQAGADSAAAAPLRAELAILDAGPALAPDEVVTAAGTRTLAGRTLRFGLETRAVTAGDVWLYDPATRVLVAGDLVTIPVPLFDTACPARWLEALDRLAAVDFALLVPGHGPPLSRGEFDAYRAAFRHLLAAAASDATPPAIANDWLRDLGGLVPAGEETFARSLLGYYLANHLRGDPAQLGGPCRE